MLQKYVIKNLYYEKNYETDFGIGDVDYIKNLKSKNIFGWIHVVQNK